MLTRLIPPSSEEYAPYYSEYVERAGAAADVLKLLVQQIGTLHSLLDPLTEEQACFRFGPDEWSVKEMTGHLGDVERVFSYRLLRISRSDITPLPGFAQDDYVRTSNFDARGLDQLVQELELLRRANLLMIQSLTDEMLERRGTASGAAVSVRALIYMIAGHVEHHISGLHQNYLPNLK